MRTLLPGQRELAVKMLAAHYDEMPEIAERAMKNAADRLGASEGMTLVRGWVTRERDPKRRLMVVIHFIGEPISRGRK